VSEKEIPSTTRLADTADMTAIYMMGYDVWGDGRPQSPYLEQCYGSQKYKRGQWYVLADSRGNPLSSLITYKLEPNVSGIGSIATPPEMRKRGLASRLISDVLELLKRDGVKTVFLFSDISPEFYEKFGFIRLPKELQRYPDSTCMVWGMPLTEIVSTPNFSAPLYF
jgi:ribosomal protein S18 acetylase RimI-like enzyme